MLLQNQRQFRGESSSKRGRWGERHKDGKQRALRDQQSHLRLPDQDGRIPIAEHSVASPRRKDSRFDPIEQLLGAMEAIHLGRRIVWSAHPVHFCSRSRLGTGNDRPRRRRSAATALTTVVPQACQNLIAEPLGGHRSGSPPAQRRPSWEAIFSRRIGSSSSFLRP